MEAYLQNVSNLSQYLQEEITKSLKLSEKSSIDVINSVLYNGILSVHILLISIVNQNLKIMQIFGVKFRTKMKPFKQNCEIIE